MTEQEINGVDIRKYRTELPNMYDDAGLSVYEFRLLAHYVRVGHCWESVRTTAKKCNMSHTMVIKTRRSLEAKKFIEVKEGSNNKGKTISITVVDMWAENCAKFTGHRVEQGGYRVEQGGHRVELKKEPIKKKPIKNKYTWIIPEDLDTPEFRAAWKEWQQHRKEIKKKLTLLAGKRTLNKLNKYTTGTAIRMLNYSIEQGYTGVFEVRGDMSIKKSTKQSLKEGGYDIRT